MVHFCAVTRRAMSPLLAEVVAMRSVLVDALRLGFGFLSIQVPLCHQRYIRQLGVPMRDRSYRLRDPRGALAYLGGQGLAHL